MTEIRLGDATLFSQVEVRGDVREQWSGRVPHPIAYEVRNEISGVAQVPWTRHPDPTFRLAMIESTPLRFEVVRTEYPFLENLVGIAIVTDVQTQARDVEIGSGRWTTEYQTDVYFSLVDVENGSLYRFVEQEGWQRGP